MKRQRKHTGDIPAGRNQIAGQNQPNRALIYGIIVVLSFVLYANTIPYDYVLDDFQVISKNEFTQKGLEGIKDILSYDTSAGFFAGKRTILVTGGRYRPLSLVTFAIEYELFGFNPHVSHIINILLYALTGILIYILLSRLLINYTFERWYFSFPFIAAILFIAHPIHTEVVANIKERDEIMSFLGVLLTLWFILNHLDYKKGKYLLYATIIFFLALMAKENAVTFIVVIPLTIYFFTDHPVKRGLTSILPLIIAAIVFFIIRQVVIGDPPVEENPTIMNDPYLYSSFSEKYATIFYALGLYIKLLFYPHPLTCDYYPHHIAIIDWSDPRAILSLIIYMALAAYALAGLKKKWIASYGILLYLITLSITSNIVFPVGVFMAERFIYFSSLGFCLIAAYLIFHKLPAYIKGEKTAHIMLGLIICAILLPYSFKTISRNTAWKDNLTLFGTDVKTSYNSAKSNIGYGSELIRKARDEKDENKKKTYYEESIKYLTRACEIDPKGTDTMTLLANIHFEYNQNYEQAIFWLEKVFAIDPEIFKVNNQLGTLYFIYKNDLGKSLFYLKNAEQMEPDSHDTLNNLGVIYYKKGDYIKAALMFERAVALMPNDVSYLKNLAMTYEKAGDNKRAAEILEKARRLDKM